MTEMPEKPFDKIAINLVTECETSTSDNKHILTIIDHLTGWLEAFLIPDRSADTIVSTFINNYLPVHVCPRYILSDNGMEFKNQLMDQGFQQLGIDNTFSAPYHPQSNGKMEVLHKYLNLHLKNSAKRIQHIGTSISIKFLLATEGCPTMPQQKHCSSSSTAGTWTYLYMSFWNWCNDFSLIQSLDYSI